MAQQQSELNILLDEDDTRYHIKGYPVANFTFAWQFPTFSLVELLGSSCHKWMTSTK